MEQQVSQDYSDIRKIIETTNAEEVNKRIAKGKGWILLSVAPGQDAETKNPYFKYSLGLLEDGWEDFKVLW